MRPTRMSSLRKSSKLAVTRPGYGAAPSCELGSFSPTTGAGWGCGGADGDSPGGELWPGPGPWAEPPSLPPLAEPEPLSPPLPLLLPSSTTVELSSCVAGCDDGCWVPVEPPGCCCCCCGCAAGVVAG